MANKFFTFLEAAGSKLKSFFANVLPEADTLAKDAEPIVDLAFPGISILFNATVAAIGTAEAAGQAASATASNGEQKLAAVLAAVGPLITAYLAQQGITASTAQITAWINAIVEALNALPASTTTTVGGSTVTVTTGA